MTGQASSIYVYDHSITWTENCRRRAYAILASPSSDDDPVDKWDRKCAAETVKYFETEHDKVVADAEADAKPVDLDRAVCPGTEMARKQGLEPGPEAVAYATDRLKSKIERDAVYNPIGEVYSVFLSYRFLKEEGSGGKVGYIDHYKRRQLEPKPPKQRNSAMTAATAIHAITVPQAFGVVRKVAPEIFAQFKPTLAKLA